MRIAVPASWLAFAVLALAPSLAWAEDSPADAAKKARAAFPEPSEKAAFSVDLEVFMDGEKKGEGSLSAVADASGDQKVWRAKASVGIGTEMQVKSAITLARDLQLLHQESTETLGTTKKITMVIRSEKGFDVAFTEGEKETVKTAVEAPAHTTTEVAVAYMLFLRQVPVAAAKYELEIYDSDDRKLKKLALDVKGAGRMKDAKLGLDVEAWVVVANDGEKVVETFFDPKDRAILGMHFGEGSPWLVKKGLVKAKAAPAPAVSAEEAGGRAMMGVLTSNKDLIVAAFHMPTVRDFQKTQGNEMTEERANEWLTEQFKKHFQTLPEDTAKMVVDGATEGATRKEIGEGAVHVTLGPPMQQFAYLAKKIGDGWYIVSVGPAPADEPK